MAKPKPITLVTATAGNVASLHPQPFAVVGGIPGANIASGRVTLVAGTATVSTTLITNTNNVDLSAQSLGTVTAPKPLAVTARTPGVSFVITSSDPTDTSVVAWSIFS